jgi:hypothetical protein
MKARAPPVKGNSVAARQAKSDGWIQRFESVTIVDVARRAGLLATGSRVQCPVGACRESGREDGRPSAHLINHGRAAKCTHSDCGWPVGKEGGGAIQYVHSFLTGDPNPPRPGDKGAWAEIRSWLDASGLGDPDPQAGQERPGRAKGDSHSRKGNVKGGSDQDTPPPVQPPANQEEADPNAPPDPTPEEVREARSTLAKRWDALTKEEGGEDVRAWLQARGLDGAAYGSWLRAFPRNIDGPVWLHHWLIDRDAKSPTYGRFTGRHLPQISRGYQIGVVAYDVNGLERRIWLRGVTPELNQPRLTKDQRAAGAKDPPTKVAPIPGANRGLVMATPNVVTWLQGKSPCPARILIVEGETDFLAARAAWGNINDLGIIGVRSGSWTPEHAKKLAAETVLLIATDNDPAGEGYAKRIEATLAGAQPRVRINVQNYYTAQPGHLVDTSKRLDICDAWRDRVLPKDPQDGAQNTPVTATKATFEVPPGYSEGLGHLYTVRENPKSGDLETAILCTEVPEVIESAVELESGHVYRCIAWKKNGLMISRWMSGGDLADPNKIATLGNAGLDVHPLNKSGLGTYFSAFMRANDKLIPVRTLIGRLGWHGRAFALGETWLEDPASTVKREVSHAEDEDGDTPVLMRAYGTGEGSLGEWCELLKPTATKPVVACSVLASLAAPLLELLGRPGFTWHLDSPQKSGKSPVLGVAFSVFGRPHPGSSPHTQPGGMLTWDDSRANLWDSLGTAKNLPIWVDDKNQNQTAEPSFFTQVAYVVANGQEPGRNKTTGRARKRRTWRTVLLSSGEGPLITADEHQGAHERVLTCSAHPWTDLDRPRPRTDKLSHEEGKLCGRLLTRDLVRVYGHLGQLYLQELQATPAAKLLQEAEEYLGEAHVLLHGHSRQHYCLFLATMLQAADIVTTITRREKVEIPWPLRRIVVWLANHLMANDQGVESTDAPTILFRKLREWCQARAGSPHFVRGKIPADRHDVLYGIFEREELTALDDDGHRAVVLGDLYLTREGLRAWIQDARIRGWDDARLIVEWGTRGFLEPNGLELPSVSVKKYGHDRRYHLKELGGTTAKHCLKILARWFD